MQSLLSEADFFVDGKDLQAFVSATLESRSFFVRRVFSVFPPLPGALVPASLICAWRLSDRASDRSSDRFDCVLSYSFCRAACCIECVGCRDRPVFHHVPARVHGRREQVLPVIAMPCRVKIKRAMRFRFNLRRHQRLEPRHHAFKFGRHTEDPLQRYLAWLQFCPDRVSVTRLVNAYVSIMPVTQQVVFGDCGL